MAKAGVDLASSTAYRWNFMYAPQMHHKFFVIDRQLLASGSYNLSDNAEHQTMENMVVYQGARHLQLAEAFAQSFDTIWTTGETDQLYEKLLSEVQNGTGAVPIVYDAMALDWQKVTTLKQAIRDACTDVDWYDFRTYPEKHFTCSR
jgi:phosphatidylserine/phosphatidylglycerophosphate/cardiolipin synthase-like enzyme